MAPSWQCLPPPVHGEVVACLQSWALVLAAVADAGVVGSAPLPSGVGSPPPAAAMGVGARGPTQTTGAEVAAVVVTAVPHHPHRQAKVAHEVGVGQHSPPAPGTGWRVVLVAVADARGGGPPDRVGASWEGVVSPAQRVCGSWMRVGVEAARWLQWHPWPPQGRALVVGRCPQSLVQEPG